MNSRSETSTITALRLVTSDVSDAVGFTPSDRGFEAPTPTARPADRCEPWPVEGTAQLRALAAAASACGVSLGLAAIVVVERGLLGSEFVAHGLEELPERLDAEAARARVAVELSEPLSAYLVALSARDRGRPASLPQSVALPMRLSERILARQGRPQLDAALLPSALGWERAGVLEGRTMSEWAAIKALELRR